MLKHLAQGSKKLLNSIINNKGGTDNTENGEYKLNQLTMDMAGSIPYQVVEWSKELLD